MCNSVDTHKQHTHETYQQVSVSVGTSQTLVVPYDSERVALLIGGQINQSLFLSSNPGRTFPDCLIVNQNGNPYNICEALHGAMVKGPIYAAMQTSAATLVYWEATRIKRYNQQLDGG